MKRSILKPFRAAVVLVALLCSWGWLGQAVAQTEVDLLVPSVRIIYPGLVPGVLSARPVPTTLTVFIESVDPDAADLRSWKYRVLWVPGYTEEGDPVQTRTVYDAHVDELIRWDDERWSGWTGFDESGGMPGVQFADLVDNDVWLLAVQVMDRDGAVSLGRGYGCEVANFKVSSSMFVPSVMLRETYLGTAMNTQPSSQIAPHQPLNFCWIADASAYNGTVVSYRHGWDLIDASDAQDPGWAAPAGTAPEDLYAAERTFAAGGLHYFYLRVEDNCGTVVLYRWRLDVVPYVSYEDQLPLLLIDQVIDDNSGRWVSQTGVPLDNAIYRDAYWHFLDEAGGVEDFDWSRDRVDQDEANMVTYADLVRYRVVLCPARSHVEQYMMSRFRAVADVDRYVWLTPYQVGGGNLFLVGDGAQDSFIESKSNYYTPFVFDSIEPDLNGYVTSYGTVALPDGSVVARGPRQYEYATAGVAALDWTSTSRKTAYGRMERISVERKSVCAGLKGLVLDDAFRSGHAIGAGALADTMLTDAAIDWLDYQAVAGGTISLSSNVFPYTEDEFVDANIAGRPTPIVPQACAAGPNGMCVEPMFTGIARYDYLRELEWAAGNTGWPYSDYAQGELSDLCGVLALEEYQGVPLGSARTNGRTFGYLSYKTVADKPSGKADVYWGFDPYRFDREQSQRAIRWVLEYFGLQLRQ